MNPSPTQPAAPSEDADARLLAVANASADGMLVVDADGRVRLANAAAEALLCRKAHELDGQIFGLPIMLGEVAEISLLQPGGDLLTAEMRTAAIIWAGAPAHMIVLRDLTEQRRIKEALRDAEGFSRTILNSLYHHIAVIDEGGTIMLVNDAWRQFAIENGDPQLRGSGVGANYFNVCASAAGADSQEAPAVLVGMRRVISGELPFFELEYPCNSPEVERWFHMRVLPLLGQRRGLVISHTDITEQRLAARAAAEASTLREQLQSRERELEALMAIAGARRAPYSGLAQRPEAPLRAARPDDFAGCVRRYADMLDAAIQARGFALPASDAGARQLAAQLGELYVAARDVVEIHLEALRSRSLGAAQSRQQAYLEEGRVLALQVMGYLVAYYRDRAAA